MDTHTKILSAIEALTALSPLEIKMNLRGSDVICLDGYDIQAYKVGNFFPLIIKLEELTPIEALLIKRACREHLQLILQAYNDECSRAYLLEIKELFRATPFGCTLNNDLQYQEDEIDRYIDLY